MESQYLLAERKTVIFFVSRIATELCHDFVRENVNCKDVLRCLSDS